MTDDLSLLIEGFQAGEIRALSKLISRVEDHPPVGATVFPRLAERIGKAHVIGVTGPPGTGKSTVIDGLIHAIRSRGDTVGVVAVDPSSPFKGGGLLGDRIRMQRHYLDLGVYIRSMATRGVLGGLARATWLVVKLLASFGFDWILVETVGVGQSEVDIARLADTTVLVLAPGMGDDIQAIKAGILEIADVILVNKADKDGAERTRNQLRWRVEQAPENDRLKPEILMSVATSGTGIELLLLHIEELWQSRVISGLDVERRRDRLREEIQLIVQDLVGRYLNDVLRAPGFAQRWADIEQYRVDTHTVAYQLVQDMTAERLLDEKT